MKFIYFIFINTRKIGKLAEEFACKYLSKSGYKIIAVNWTCYAGEIDIVSENPGNHNFLVFVEVKSVTNERYIKPYELFHAQKRRNLFRTINSYLFKEKCLNRKWRLDLICLVKKNTEYKISHFENVIE